VIGPLRRLVRLLYKRNDCVTAMPNTTTAKKALRQSAKRRLQNRSQKSALKTAIKKVRTLVASGDAAGAKDAFQAATKKLDQAADKHLIHKNTAARTKSRLASAVKKADGK
jgi:small subunit ribosomal protein S20